MLVRTARNLSSRTIDLEHEDLELDTPQQNMPFSGQGRRYQDAEIPCGEKRSFSSDMSQFHVCSQAARDLRSRPIDLEHEDLEQDTPEQKTPASGSARETRMSKRLKQASMKPESEEAEDEVADDLGADEDDDDEDEAEV